MSYIKSLPLLLLTSLICLQAKAQFREFRYTTVLADSALQLQIRLLDSIEIFPWYNSAVLIETEVNMSGCPESLLRHVAGDGRYTLVGSHTSEKISFVQEKPRGVLNGPKGPCDEVIRHRIYIPADFESAGKGKWTRSEPHSKTTINYD
jgi:hypothetical protein